MSGAGQVINPLLSTTRLLTLAGDTVALTVSGGVAFVYGEIGYCLADGTIRKAKSNGTAAEAEGEWICVAAAGVANGASGLFRFSPGIVTALTGGTAGSLAYVSTSAGGLTTTAPATGFSKIMGRWLSATAFLFNSDRNTYAL